MILLDRALFIPEEEYNGIFEKVKSKVESEISDDRNRDYVPSLLSLNTN